MCDVESHTVCYLRDLLVTPSHADPEVTTFLTMWNYEEYWHEPSQQATGRMNLSPQPVAGPLRAE